MFSPQSQVPSERDRLEVLRRYAILDTPPESALDDLTQLAATICQVPMAMISLVDDTRLWVKARVGVKLSEAPREGSLCEHTLQAPGLLIIPDTAVDPRFADNPMVQGKNGVRFYAGAPLRTAAGHALGALCVMDRMPRNLNPAQQQSLEILAQQVMTHFELRKRLLELEEGQARTAAIVDAAIDGIVIIDHAGLILEFNPAAEKIFQRRRQDVLGCELAAIIIPPSMRDRHRQGLAQCVASGLDRVSGQRIEFPALRADGSEFPAELSIARRKGGGEPQFIGFIRDVSEQKEAAQASRANAEKLRAIFHAEPECVKLLEVDSTLREMNVSGLTLIEAASFDEVIGRALIPLLVVEEDRPRVGEMLAEVARGEHRSITFRIVGLRGTPRWVEMSGAPFHDESTNRDLILAVSRDITESKSAEERLKRLHRLYAVSSGINEAIVRVGDTQDLYEQACKIAVEQGGMVMAWIAMADAAANFLVPVASWGRDDGYLQNIRVSTAADDPTGLGPAGRAFRTGKVAECHDISDPNEHFVYRAEALRRGYRSCSAFPLIKEGKPFGLIVVYGTETGYFEKEELRVLNSLAENLSFAVESRQSEAKRREAERALRESEERFRQLADNIQEVFWVTDVAERQLLYVSPAFEAISGLTRESLYASPISWRELIHPDDRDRVILATETGANGGPYDEVYQMLRPDGAVRWIRQRGFPVTNAAGEIYRMVGTAEDITQQKLAEEALRKSEAQLAAAQAYAKLGSWEMDLTTGEGTFSTEMFRIFRIDPAAGVPPLDKFLDLVHPDDRRSVAEAMRQMHDLKKPLFLEYRSNPEHGPERHLLATIHPIRNVPGQVVRAAGTLQDITDQKNLEQQLLRAQRMDSLGTLASGIAHDLNNALSPIITSLELLTLKFTDVDSRELLDIISTSAQRGADMVRQVLSFSRGFEGRRIAVGVKELIRAVEKIANDTFLKHIEVRVTAPGDLWAVTGDPTQLHQVLLNLCLNARDAMPHGGRLTLSAQNRMIDEHEAGFSLGLKPGPYVMIEVRDNGAGIPPQNLEKIFDPFFTTKEAGKGTGLGLSTSLGIVKSHAGCMRVESKLGEGTRFEVFLPAQARPAVSLEEESATALPRGGDQLILVVDDEANVRAITQRTLELYGYRVICAHDGVEAIALFARRKAEIAAVVTDMTMPVMDGLTTIRVLHNMNPRLPIIAASGLELPVQFAELTALGVKHFLPKPYSAEALLSTLHELLAAG